MNEGLNNLRLMATKAMTAHGIGLTGLLEILTLQRALRDRVIPGIPNLRAVLPLSKKIKDQCGLVFDPDHYDMFNTKAIPWDGDYAMSNSFGFGGNNGAVVIRRYVP